MDNYKTNLLQISTFAGRVPLIGSWFIFLLWLSVRYLNASDPNWLGTIAAIWALFCFAVIIIGFVSLVIYFFSDINKDIKKAFFIVFMILLNFPTLLIIWKCDTDIQKKVFIKLKNNTNSNITDLAFSNKKQTINLGKLNSENSIVFNYQPAFKMNDARIYLAPDTLILVIKNGSQNDTISFPVIEMGTCKHLALNKKFIVEEQ